MFYYLLLSSLSRSDKLFENCVTKLSNYDPKWPRERIMQVLDKEHYDCFICRDTEDPNNMLGAIAFNPDKQNNIAKVFLIYVVKQLRGQGMGSSFVAKFIIWTIENGFKGVQIGLGNSPEAVAVLKSINRQKNQLFRKYASSIEITPETGVVKFNLS